MENFENVVEGSGQLSPKANMEPSLAFVGATWAALIVGVVAYNVGLYNASMQLNEKGYYFVVLLYGLFSAVSVQKSVRDRIEGLPISGIYYGISWFSAIVAIILLTIGLYNATLTLSEKGFYGMSFALSLFSAITVQKNVRDYMAARKKR
ncbi:inner membrane protein YiaA [Paludibacter sp.]|uniref:inner membrane protein YiaA n=1 Tax=Paludibacter sp. TaxID=1898105 RepID=UPI001352F0EF|nr:inner membrane protein YiaA [Paludibacter sp.]MTK53063.1 hypothetical protein [Paludibacter sp.]